MKKIAHRGNTQGPVPERENHPDYIREAMLDGFDVEVDLWFVDGKVFLGHDEPQYEYHIALLLWYKDKLWCHAKNLEALEMLVRYKLHCFWHQSDDYTLTSKGFIWTYPGKEVTEKSVIVLQDDKPFDRLCYGVCSDYVALI